MNRTLLFVCITFCIFNSCNINYTFDFKCNLKGNSDARLIEAGHLCSRMTSTQFNQNKKFHIETEDLEDYTLPIKLERNFKGIQQILASSHSKITKSYNRTTKLVCDSISYDGTSKTYDLSGKCHTDYIEVVNDNDTNKYVVESDYHVSLAMDLNKRFSQKVLPVVIQDLVLKQIDEQAQKIVQKRKI